ncbi:MAG: hypothetical protein OXC93_04725 [Rhodospirillaceae bacterium]|nr:hypothetical protein [Rhodospirillaceae bacterium]
MWFGTSIPVCACDAQALKPGTSSARMERSGERHQTSSQELQLYNRRLRRRIAMLNAADDSRSRVETSRAASEIPPKLSDQIS